MISKKEFSATKFPPYTEETMDIFEDLWQQERDLFERSRMCMEKSLEIYRDSDAIESVVA